MIKRLHALWLLVCLACGVQPVELLPTTSSVGTDEFVVGDVPAQAIARLQSQRSEQGPDMLRLIYPAAPELVVPADLAPIAFEWQGKGKAAVMPMEMPPPPPPAAMPEEMMMMGGPKAEKAKADKEAKQQPVAYELRAHSDSADVRVYAAREQAAFPIERWRSLLRMHTGATLTIELRGVSASGEITHAPALLLSVRGAMAGVFYNFSTTGQGLTRAQLKDTHEQIELVPAPLEAAKEQRCVGCHAISRDGRHVLAASMEPSALLRWSKLSLAPWEMAWPGAADTAHRYIRAVFDPLATRIAATRGGQLLLLNADTGAVLDRSAMPLMAAVAAPDWSPNGRTIVVETGRDLSDSGGGSLATIDVGLGDSLSALEPLINATGDERLRSPSYSPIDGEWIVFERRMGPEGKDPKLFVVRASGGDPIELKALQKGARPMDGASSPSFAPGDAPGHAYVLFSSQRAVGSWVPEEGKRQLFAAELNLALAAQGEDPSNAAFWLPFQQRSNSYVRTQWGPAIEDCTRSVEVCDGADDNCNQEVDEDCCTPAAESCDDGADNDCDGRADEGCGCAFQESCGNAKDDDCDLAVDEKPCMPPPATR